MGYYEVNPPPRWDFFTQDKDLAREVAVYVDSTPFEVDYCSETTVYCVPDIYPKELLGYKLNFFGRPCSFSLIQVMDSAPIEKESAFHCNLDEELESDS